MKKVVPATLAAIAAIALVRPSLAAPESAGEVDPELSRVRASIDAEGLDWVAGPTSMSRLSRAERLRRISPPGTLPPWVGRYEPRDTQVVRRSALPLPPSIDWRDYKGFRFTPDPRDQGSCGSCWAFSMVGALEPLLSYRRSIASPTLDLSEQHLLDCAAASLSCDSGGITWGPPGMFLTGTGVTSESCYPYTSGDSGEKGLCTLVSVMDPACQQEIVVVDDVVELLSTLPGFPQWDPPPFSLSDSAMEEIKTLLQDRPVGVTMRTFSDLYWYQGGIYEPSATASYEGMHAVVFVGYDDAQQCWIVRNSWGDDWGEAGYFRVRYNTSSIGMWAFVHEYEESAIDPAFCPDIPVSITLDVRLPDETVEVPIANCGANVLSWELTSTKPWVGLIDAGGNPVTGGDEVADGRVYRAKLTGAVAAGEFATLVLTGAPNGPKTIEVRTIESEAPDAGIVPDAGIEPDAGLPEDAGLLPEDAGLEIDAGLVPDAGVAPADAGQPPPPVDAGLEPAAPDAGQAPENQTETESEGGCGCSQPGAGSLVAAFASLGLALPRRRRRA